MTSNNLIRPICPKCAMNMVALPKTTTKQTYECLRCGHIEQRAPSETG